ncbi:MAG: hypothetical protein JWO09_2223 [Bacteroidetes bacterium]|nr:hypothetical protein [Bacteroidota bacterium]
MYYLLLSKCASGFQGKIGKFFHDRTALAKSCRTFTLFRPALLILLLLFIFLKELI